MAATVGNVSVGPAASNVASIAWDHDNNGDVLVVEVAGRAGSGSAEVTGVTYAGVAMTKVVGVPLTNLLASLWWLAAPPQGINQVVATTNVTSANMTGGATSVLGGHQSDSNAANALTATGTSTTPSIVGLSAPTGSVAFAVVSKANATEALTDNAGQVALFQKSASNFTGAAARKDGSGTVGLGWTAPVSRSWVVSAVAVLEAPAPVDTTRPSVTINQAAGQADPTTASPVNFAVEFSEPVTGFTGADVALSGTAGATTATVSGSGASYTVAVSGMTTSGTVIATIPANVAQDAAGNLNTASTSTDNTVTYTAAPKNLSTVAVSSSQIDLAWDASAGADSYKVERSADEGLTWTQIAAGVTTATYSDATAAEGTTYHYRVRATNATGDSGYSNVATASTPRAWIPQPTILVAFDTDPLSPAPVYTDVSDFGSELAITQGRQQELDAFQPGTIRGPLDNSDRRFDPRHTTGPHFGKLKPRKRVQVRTTQGGTVYDLATGFVHGWPQSYAHPEMAATELSATDGFLLLASAELPGSVYELEVLKDDPHAWWRLGETDGTQAVDSGPNQYHGTYVGGATFNTRQSLIFGDDNNGIEFDPARKQSVGVLSADVPTWPLTVEFWLQVTPEQKPPNSARIWSQGDGRDARISFRADGTIGALLGDVVAITPESYADGQVHHVVVRVSEFGVRIFVDGISRVLTFGAPGLFTRGPVFLAQSGTFPHFAGTLDEVAMYRSIVSDARIVDHYVAGTKPWDGDTTGARVNKVLDLIGWPAADRDVDAGNSTLGPAQLRRRKALEYLQLVERTEQGALYIKPDGPLRFRERHQRFYDARMTTPQFTLTDEDLPGALHYEGDLQLNYDEDIIYNEVTVRWEGGEVTVSDQASIAAYGRKSQSIDTIARTADDARWIGEWVLDHYREPQTRVSSVTVNPGVDPLLWEAALVSRVGDRIKLRRLPQGIGDPFELESHIEGKEHAIGTDTWTTTLPLSVAETKRYWILGSSALGTDTYLGY